jgi:hypothetical protein
MRLVPSPRWSERTLSRPGRYSVEEPFFATMDVTHSLYKMHRYRMALKNFRVAGLRATTHGMSGGSAQILSPGDAQACAGQSHASGASRAGTSNGHRVPKRSSSKSFSPGCESASTRWEANPDSAISGDSRAPLFHRDAELELLGSDRSVATCCFRFSWRVYGGWLGPCGSSPQTFWESMRDGGRRVESGGIILTPG